jgi:hypothetical protein
MSLAAMRSLFDAVMSGCSAEELKPRVDKLPFEERDQLLRALYSVRPEVAAKCQARAAEIDRLLNLRSP